VPDKVKSAPEITKKSQGPRVEALQKALDRELVHWKFPWRKIKIDGIAGPRTFDACNMVGWLKGFSPDELKKISGGHISERDVEILSGEAHRTDAMEKRSEERRDDAERLRKKRRWLEEHPDSRPAPAGGDWVMFDNEEVPKWMVEEALKPARESGVWNGEVFSGRRSPEHCEELCLDMCGAATCPGKCGGRSSNHCGPASFKGDHGEGAVDVTDPDGLRTWCEAHGDPIRGGGAVLPEDRPHFSRAGN